MSTTSAGRDALTSADVDMVAAQPLAPDAIIAALGLAAERFDRVAAVELYRAYERAVARVGDSAEDRVVEAYRAALWRERPKMREEGALPRFPTAFFGRTREIGRVTDLLHRSSTVTLTGVAGVGKTRTALAIAERVRASFADDVRYAESGDDITAAIARAAMGDDLQMLVVLDGVVASADVRAAIARLRVTHPRSPVLITSRARVGIPNEHVVELAPFALPLADAPPPAIVITPAIAFFVERASLTGSYLYDDRDAADIARLCAALDGLPLALELAAAQLRFFSLRELCARVVRPDFAPTSLEATLRGTLELLDRDERRLFHRLALFEAPWTVPEAEAICSGDGLELEAVTPAMIRLVERSLLQTEVRGNVVRYRYLETIRRVALAGNDASRIRARERAVAWYVAEMLEPGLDGIPDTATMECFAERHEALAHVLDRWCTDDAAVLRAVVSTRKYWEWRGLAAENLARLEAKEEALDLADRAFAFAVARTRTTHALAIGDNERAEAGVVQMLALVDKDDARSIEASHNAAILAYNTGRVDDAIVLLERVAAMQHGRGVALDHARTVMNLAAVDMARRDWTRAESRLASIAHVEHARNEAVFVSRNRAYAAAMRGELATARSFAADAVRRCENDPTISLEWRIELEHALGVIEFQDGNWYGAIRHQQHALLVAARIPPRLALLPLEHAALAAHRIGRSSDALVLLAYVEAQRQNTGLRRSAQFDQFFSEERRAIVAACGARAVEHETIGASLRGERAAEIAFALPIEPARPSRLATLGDREREVATLIGNGASNREIAETLVISVRTVDNHVASIFAKLDVTRRAHVAMIVREERTA